MATIIEQQVALDEALVPSTQRCPFFKAFLVTADVPKIYMQELWATAYVHQHSIRFKLDNKNHIVNLETFRDMLHICPRIPGQSFDELPFEEEILEFLRRNIDYAFMIWEDFVYQVKHKNNKKCNEMYYPRFTKNTQQYGVMLPIELTNDEIKNTNAYKEYYACATGEATPKPKASARRKRSGSDTSITPPTAITTPTTTVAIAPRLTTVAKGKQPTKAKNKGTGSKPGVPDVPSDDSEEEISWNFSDDEEDDAQEKDKDDDEVDEKDESNDGEEDDDDDKDGDERDDDDDDDADDEEESDDEETKEEKSFDPIPRTPEDSEDDGNGEEDQGLRISEEERLNEDEEADELY
nr:hypothetical protein [Tanacetum cinerariifolium]